MLKVLVTGANGQLGRAIKKLSDFYKDIDLIFTDIPELDLTDKTSTNAFVLNSGVSYIINCAAFTAVDDAEIQKESAFLVNSEALRILSEIALKTGIRIIHISTDYVFDGKSFRPYTEEDITNPKTVYGQSKLEGEKHLLAIGNSMIIRTSWLYSEMEQSFVQKILKVAKQNKEIKVIYDQIGSPTSAYDLAKVILEIVSGVQDKKFDFVPGIFHYSNEGIASWYDFAVDILKSQNIICKVVPVESDEYPTRAIRPHYSVLSKRKIKNTYGIQISHWRTSLQYLMNNIK